ncbi:MAG TPA: aminotransferase class I/II-fold pyridoxal phosphate-dependent enzyme [Candidatus Eisenbacteria bacterium]|nr:aminotransferase class I/II-fold pyridoxal phosphate-dependent enzyme [Candidatus Eisenbacteria bacterium]
MSERPDPSRTSSRTRAVHGGRAEGPGPVVAPLVQSSTFAFADHDAMLAAFHAKDQGVVYSRYSNPTLMACEERLAAVEGAEASLAFASGMAAITSAVLSFVRAGERVLAQREIYGGSHEFFSHWAPRLGIEVDWFGANDEKELAAGLARRPAVVYLETPTNPTLRCVDLRDAATRARAAGAVSIVDGTFASPMNQRPLDLGIDLVVHSATKYLAGHADLVAGCVCGARDKIKTLWRARKLFGGTLDPHGAFLLERSLRTLAVRMEAHNTNGLEVARFLAGHAAVERVYYPGLPSHPDHETARRQMAGFGGMVTVSVRGDGQAAIRFAESLQLFRLAPSLGGVESLVSIPATSSHYALSAAERERAGVPDNMVRLSLGIEDAEDLIRDLDQALGRAGGRAAATAAAERGSA